MPALGNAAPRPGYIFVSHAGADTQAAHELAVILRRNGLEVWFDKDNLPPGADWMADIQDAISRASAMVVYIGRLGIQAWVDREVRFGLVRNTRDREAFRFIPVLGEGADVERLPPFVQQHQCVDLRDSRRASEQIARLLEVLRKSSTSDTAVPPEYWSTHCPFRSLQSFVPGDSWLFFGRDRDTAELLTRLGRSPTLAVIGNSGSGKSSLIQAGLIPALRRGRFLSGSHPVESWRIAVFRPSAAPFDYLAESLPAQLSPEMSEKDRFEFVEYCKPKLPKSREALRNAIVGLVGPGGNGSIAPHVLLVADQFEELFTLVEDKKVRARYIECLLAAARLDAPVPVHLVLGVRADFYAQCLENPNLSATLQANLYNVPGIGPLQLREAIENRLALASASSDSGLIDSLLADVGEEPGNLALLEHALTLLWEKSADSNRTLTNEAYAAIGRLQGALGTHADTVYGGLPAEDRPLAQKILLELVQLGERSQDTRRRVPKQELLQLGAPDRVGRVIARLVDERLLTTSGEGPQSPEENFVEVSHEALIREWPALRGWLQDNREDLRLGSRLRQAADEWSGLNKHPSALLQGARLALAREWLSRRPEASPLVREFLAASGAAEEGAARKERQTASRLRKLAYALAALLVLVGVAALVARQLQLTAESRALAAQSDAILGVDSAEALQLAVAAYERHATQEAEMALWKAMSQPMTRAVLHKRGDPTGAAWSPDGRTVLVWGKDGIAHLWGVETGVGTADLEHPSSIAAGSFSPDSQHALTAGSDGVARLWNVADGRLLRSLRPPDTAEGGLSPLVDARFSPDGGHIVTASQDGSVRLWDAASGNHRLTMVQENSLGIAAYIDEAHVVTAGRQGTARIWSTISGRITGTLRGRRGNSSAFAVAPDGEMFAIGFSDGGIQTWNARSAPESTHFVAGASQVYRIRFSPDGTHIVTLGYGGSARVWETENGRAVCDLNGHEGAVFDAAFSPDSTRLATAGEDGSARLWSADTCQSMAALAGHTEMVRVVVWSPKGDRLVTVSADGTARDWDTEPASLLTTLRGHTNTVWQAAFSNDGLRLVTASADRTARIWGAVTGVLLTTLAAHNADVSLAQFSPTGKYVVTAGGDLTVRLWDANTGDAASTLSGYASPVEALEFSSDDRQLLTLTWDGLLRVTDTSTGRIVGQLDGGTDPIVAATLVPEAPPFVALTSGGRLLKGSATWIALPQTTTPVAGARWSKDRRLMVLLHQGIVQVYDFGLHPLTGAPALRIIELPNLGTGIPLAEVSPDGSRVIVAPFRRPSIWTRGSTSATPARLAHQAPILSVAFSPDGKRVLTTSEDRTARIWDSNSGQLLTILWGHTGRVIHGAFSRDGKRLATTSSDYTVRVYASSIPELLIVAKRLISARDGIWSVSRTNNARF
jgi:WD40 repeat protein